MKLTRVTITGADDRIFMDDLSMLSVKFPFVEWGILRSQSKEGELRYPSSNWAWVFVDRCNRSFMNSAAHLCGEWCRDALRGPFLWAIKHPDEFSRFERFQLNTAIGPSEMDRVVMLARKLAKKFIVQVSSMRRVDFIAPQNNLWEPGGIECDRIHFLIDASGGEGRELSEFVPPPLNRKCGYAGGIGPANIRQVLEKLTALPGDAEFWVDMESGVRTNNQFDLAKVEQCLTIAKEVIA